MTTTPPRSGIQPFCPVIDIHVHPLRFRGLPDTSTPESDGRALLTAADRNGVTRLCIFDLFPGSPPEPTPEQLRDCNDYVRRMRVVAPERLLPFVYVNPMYPEESVAEIDRCVGEHRFAGVKLWIARRATDPGLDPIMAAAARQGVPVLQHAWIKTTGNLSGESTPADVADLARRHPRVPIIMAHLNGCGLRGIEDVADTPNVVVDISGGDPESTLVEAAVQTLGRHRVLFGSDAPVRHFGVCVGKAMGAALSDEVKRDIFWNNAARILPSWVNVTPIDDSYTASDKPARDITDIGAWIGTWPTLPVHGAVEAVRASLRAVGVVKMHISPLEAAWAINPHLHNDAVYEAAARFDDVCPLPVLDPTIATWRRELQRAIDHDRVRMIKLLPSFVPYDLSHADDLCTEAAAAGLAVVVQTRMDDPRRHHPLAMVAPLSVGEVVRLAERHSGLKVIIGGLHKSELQPAIEAMSAMKNLFAETAHLDGFDTLLDVLNAARQPDGRPSGLASQLLFASHAPIFMPWSAVARVANDLSPEETAMILHLNAAGFA